MADEERTLMGFPVKEKFLPPNGWTLGDWSAYDAAKPCLTVGELRAAMAKYPDEMPIRATWEGITTRIRKVYLDPVPLDLEADPPPPPTVMLDVDEH